MLDKEWQDFTQQWYEDQSTHFYFRNFGNWRICVRPDPEEEDKFAWAVYNFETRAGDHRAPFSNRVAAVKNVFLQLMLWEAKVDSQTAQDWLLQSYGMTPTVIN